MFRGILATALGLRWGGSGEQAHGWALMGGVILIGDALRLRKASAS